MRLVEEPLEFSDEVLLAFLARAESHLDQSSLRPFGQARSLPFLEAMRKEIEQQWSVLAHLNDPLGMYAMCFCEAE